jgi:hypothetical protein
MPEIPHMGFRFNVTLVFVMGFIAGVILPGCISYQFVRQIKGSEVMSPGDTLKAGSTTLGEVLCLYGAPDAIKALGAEDLLIYERTLYGNSGLSFGIPFGDFSFVNPEISARGGLGRHDTLALFFTSDRIVRYIVYTKGSSCPYLKAMLEEESAAGDCKRVEHQNGDAYPGDKKGAGKGR